MIVTMLGLTGAAVVERTPERVVVEAAQGELLFGHVEFFAEECPTERWLEVTISHPDRVEPERWRVDLEQWRQEGDCSSSSPNRWGRFASCWRRNVTASEQCPMSSSRTGVLTGQRAARCRISTRRCPTCAS